MGRRGSRRKGAGLSSGWLTPAGARRAKERVWLTKAGELEVPRPGREPVRLRCAFQYTHMGGRVDANGGMQPELRERASAARGVHIPLRRQVLAREQLTQPTRHALAEALVGSRLRYNCHMGLPLSKGAQQLWWQANLQLCRDVTGRRSGPDVHWSDRDALLAGPFVDPGESLSVARLRFLPRLLRSGPPCPPGLVAAGRPRRSPPQVVAWCLAGGSSLDAPPCQDALGRGRGGAHCSSL